MRGPGPGRRKVDAVWRQSPSPGCPPGRPLAKAAPGDEEQRNAGQRVDKAVEGMNGKDRLGGVNAEETEKHCNDQRINGRHHRRRLGGNHGAAKTLASHQRPRHIALFPGVDVVGIHQILNVIEGNHRQAEGKRHQNDDKKTPAGGALPFFFDKQNSKGRHVFPFSGKRCRATSISSFWEVRRGYFRGDYSPISVKNSRS